MLSTQGNKVMHMEEPGFVVTVKVKSNNHHHHKPTRISISVYQSQISSPEVPTKSYRLCLESSQP